jgi:hypothetical protein
VCVQHRQQMMGLSAYDRHKKFVNDYGAPRPHARGSTLGFVR